MTQSAEDIFKDLVIKLTGIYESSEAKSISYLLLEEMFDIEKSMIVLNKNIEMGPDKMRKLEEVKERLLNHEPVQHIIGRGYFYNRPFNVNENVLVPRQETEEIVARIAKKNNKENHKILDIGTGTGCIAITLGYEMKNPELHAWDVSPEALEVAKTNALLHKMKVRFREVDILGEVKDENEYDVIVSNPPYVKEGEKIKMKKNVLKFDPPLALFVPNDDPLKFHKAIGQFAKERLRSGGNLYMEINEKLGADTFELINSLGYTRVKIIKDLNDKDRFVSAMKP
jgi:release factor glutamine methyltransferase